MITHCLSSLYGSHYCRLAEKSFVSNTLLTLEATTGSMEAAGALTLSAGSGAVLWSSLTGHIPPPVRPLSTSQAFQPQCILECCMFTQ